MITPKMLILHGNYPDTTTFFGNGVKVSTIAYLSFLKKKTIIVHTCA
jgi:hypothetical protein